MVRAGDWENVLHKTNWRHQNSDNWNFILEKTEIVFFFLADYIFSSEKYIMAWCCINTWSSILRSKEIDYESVNGFFMVFKCYTMLKFPLLILMNKVLQATLHILFSSHYEITVHKEMIETSNMDIKYPSVIIIWIKNIKPNKP